MFTSSHFYSLVNRDARRVKATSEINVDFHFSAENLYYNIDEIKSFIGKYWKKGLRFFIASILRIRICSPLCISCNVCMISLIKLYFSANFLYFYILYVVGRCWSLLKFIRLQVEAHSLTAFHILLSYYSEFPIVLPLYLTEMPEILSQLHTSTVYVGLFLPSPTLLYFYIKTEILPTN